MSNKCMEKFIRKYPESPVPTKLYLKFLYQTTGSEIDEK
jgi:hypothetical protein